jgi:pimeloyl-ACP methyl ester carboxylesterase
MSIESHREKFLDLPGGRVLAYEDGGNPDSKTIVLFFHGAFSVGDAKRPSPVIFKHDVHYLAPTLPGWGNSSNRTNPGKTPYYLALAQDIAALLEHLHPGCSNAPAGEYKLYVSGGSFGTVPAQMIFNASLEVLPAGKHIVACLLLAPGTPLKQHKDYAKDLTWGNYFSVGPPSRYIPWQLVHRLASVVLSKKLKRVEDSEAMIRSLIFDNFKEDEKALFQKWRKERGLEEGQLEKGMAANMRKSVSKSWQGFLECGDVMHSDWGFTLEEMSHKPVILVSGSEDKMMPAPWAKWLAEKYPNAKLKEVIGGHIAGLWLIDSIWEEVLGIKG